MTRNRHGFGPEISALARNPAQTTAQAVQCSCDTLDGFYHPFYRVGIIYPN
jgi:hypothetical protein